jgi:hypothetical protein
MIQYFTDLPHYLKPHGAGRIIAAKQQGGLVGYAETGSHS